jgi:hypothetical protein
MEIMKSARFSKRHYTSLAKVIARCPRNLDGQQTLRWIIDELALLFQGDNPRFRNEFWLNEIGGLQWLEKKAEEGRASFQQTSKE